MAKGFRFEPDRAAIQQAGMAIARRTVTDVTRRVLNRAIILTPVDTGNLRASNQMRVRQQGTKIVGEVINPVTYSGPVHDGSRAYVVRPRRRKALRFVVGGQVVFAKSARIPARRGRPWLLRAMREVAGSLGWTVTEL